MSMKAYANKLVVVIAFCAGAILLLQANQQALADIESLHEHYEPEANELILGEIAYVDSATPPVGADWQAVRLPHLWPREAPAATYAGWYRLKLDDVPPVEVTAAYLWRFSMNIAVYLNDEFLGDGGSFEEPVSRNWNRPFLFVLPKNAWRETDNYLYVRIQTYPGWGHMAPVVIGPHDELKIDYDKRFLWQITFSQFTFIISLLSAFVATSIWLSDRTWSVYGFFALTCLAWSGYSLNQYIQDIPVSAKTWWWFVHSSVDWYGILLVLFGHRLLKLNRPRVEQLAISFGVISTLAYFIMPLETLSKVNNNIHLVTVVLAMYLLFSAIRVGVRRPSIESGALTVCLLMIIFFAFHDLGMNSMVTVSLWKDQFFWLQFSTPILMLTMLIVLTRQYTRTLQDKLSTEQQVSLERERIFTDIHDDIGSRMLSLVYAAKTEPQASIARDALKDVRLIVAGATNNPRQATEFFDLITAEAQERCDSAGFELDWQTEIAQDFELNATFQYHLQRINRELISNSLRHSGGNSIRVRCELTATATLNLSIDDNGASQNDDSKHGNGMAGVSRRVRELGGDVSWQQTANGWHTQLQLSLYGESNHG